MFANALVWVRKWALKRIVRDYMLKPLTSRGGPGCPPLAPATPVPKTDHLLKRDLAWAVMVESLRAARDQNEYSEARKQWFGWFGVDLGKCTIPPKGWSCSRGAGHDGPCAARPSSFKPVRANGDGLSRRSTESERSEAPCAPYRGPLGLHGGWPERPWPQHTITVVESEVLRKAFSRMTRHAFDEDRH